MSSQEEYIHEEEGELVFDLRSLDLTELTLKQVKFACSPKSVLRPTLPGSLSTVTHLLLDHNDILELPTEIGDIHCLRKLSLIGNQLSSLSGSIGKLEQLKILNISENEITDLPASIKNLRNLETFSAVANDLHCFVENGFCGELQSLKQLYLDENLLTKLPDDFGKLSNLEVFECSENNIQALPSGFGDLQNLRTLNLDSNRISILPEDFCKLPNLNVLLLSNNNIQNLPNTMSCAKVLEKLVLSKNDLSSLPQWIDDLENIQELAVEDNELLDQVFTEKFCESAVKITTLLAGRNYMTNLPENIGSLTNLTVLHVGSTMYELERSNFQSGNWLFQIPDSFAELVNLKKLHLDENQIRSLPTEIGNLTKLEWLDLGQNQLKSLPESFCNLTELTYLQLSKNRLESLPDDLGNLDKLVELRLDSNVITKIPESISKLKVLHSLDLFNNCLPEFPKEILQMTHLKRLDVEKNNFGTDSIPKIIKENAYPERDKSLQDNWRGKTREDKVKCEIIEMPAVESENDANLEEEDNEDICFNDNALFHAMRAGMSLWKHHTGPSEREVHARGDDAPDVTDDSHLDDDTSNAKIPLPMNLPQELQVNLDVSSLKLDEDWDVEIKEDEQYQQTLNTHTKRKDVNSTLIDAFQNSINRYPPCMHAYSQTACYDSLVYKKSSKSENKGIVHGMQEDGQFEDVEE